MKYLAFSFVFILVLSEITASSINVDFFRGLHEGFNLEYNIQNLEYNIQNNKILD